MTQLTRYLTADLANTAPNSLDFPGDEKSQRALRASKNKVDPNTDKITKETLFQIVKLENISQSKLAKLDDLLAADDMDAVGADRLRGRQPRIIRNINVDDQVNDNGQQDQIYTVSNQNDMFKLLLQDCFGNLVYGIELEKLPFLTGKNYKSGFPIQLGSKLMINNAEIVGGVIFLKPSNVEFLSGMVQPWNIDLNKRHIADLKEGLEKIRQEAPQED